MITTKVFLAADRQGRLNYIQDQENKIARLKNMDIDPNDTQKVSTQQAAIKCYEYSLQNRKEMLNW